MKMDATSLLVACKQHRLFRTPGLNDKLYANFQGFTTIAGLESYTGLRALFLEGNALESTAGLPPLPELRCLFLQQNLLTQLAPGSLAAQPLLDTLNVSGNQLADLSGLAGCTQLRTLIATDNQLASAAGLAALAQCTALESLDLQNNRLEGGEEVLAVLACLPHLKCLYLKGNPLVSGMRSYRKATIAALPGLTYLDDRPVFEVERLCAEAWARGGLDAEREARAAHRQRELEREQRQVQALREIREAGWNKRREARGLAPGGGDPYLEGLPHDWQPEESWQEEPAELRAARERLAALTASRQPQGEEEGLPALMEVDVQAVLEESRAGQAALLDNSCSQQQSCAAVPACTGGRGGAGFIAENNCPNSGNTIRGSCAGAGADPAVPAAPAELPAAEVPEARVTVRIRGSSCAASAGPAGRSGEAELRGAAAAVADMEDSQELPIAAEGGGGSSGSSSGDASSPPEASGDSDGKGSASLAAPSDDEGEDDLDALD